MGRRTKARECAVQILYQWEATGSAIDDVIATFWRLRGGTGAMRSMAERLARGAALDKARIDESIGAAATHWRLPRIATVDLCVLRVAVHELMNEPQTPASVVIDEAVELAKRFGESESPSFVNGVLDAIKRRVRTGEDPS